MHVENPATEQKRRSKQEQGTAERSAELNRDGGLSRSFQRAQ